MPDPPHTAPATAEMTAVEIATLVGRGELSAEEAVRGALDRAERLDASLNAFVALDPAGALRRARDVDARCRDGEALPLAGVPVPLKASQARDGALARRLAAAGAVVIGTTSTPPRGYHQTWGLAPRGRTRNPWDPGRSPGGSSAGAGAVVAAGIVPLATGGDSAGSLRIPAAWCGVVAHKPTAGLLPRRHVGTYRLTTSGALSRSVADQVRFLEAVATSPAASLATGPEAPTARPLRAAWTSDLGHVEVVAEVAAVARARAESLAADGAVAWADRAVPLLSLRDVWGRLRRAERLSLEGAAVPDDLVTPAALAVRSENLRRLERLFEDVDVLLLPTTPVTAHPVEEDPPGYECELTWVFNVAGLPATSVPAGRTRAGLHVGLQIVARRGADAACLALARVLERRHGAAPVAPAAGTPAPAAASVRAGREG